jgi:prepilin-type N-terminal cleavage/methylation domain-containing protein
MHMSLKRIRSAGFTVVELLIVIVIIGLLASIAIISYNGIQKGAIDKGVSSDLDGVSSALTHYQVTHNGQLDSSVAWFSGSGGNSAINYALTSGDVLDVAVNSTDYCIRGYNPNAKTYINLAAAASKGSTASACAMLPPSSAAIAANYTFASVAWTQQTGSGSRNWYGLDSSTDGTKIFGVANGDYIYTSTNTGATWTQAGVSLGTQSWYAITLSADGTTSAAASYGYLYGAPDSGVTWTQHGSSQYWGAIVSSYDGTKVYAGTNSVYASTDSGVTWTATSAPWAGSGYNSMAVSADGTQVVAVNSSGVIYQSTNSGATWAALPGISTATYVASSYDGTKLATASYNGYISTSTNSGASWTQQTGSGSRPWSALVSSAVGTKLAATTLNGYIYTSINGGVTWVQQTGAGSRYWKALTISADGTKIAAAASTGYVYTGQFN